jgi:hypothetical protein
MVEIKYEIIDEPVRHFGGSGRSIGVLIFNNIGINSK